MARPILGAMLVLCAVAAHADEVDVLHDGTWSVAIRTDGGMKQSARLVVKAFGGDWTPTSAPGGPRGKACIGKKLPITVQSTTAEGLAFTVWGSSVSPDCPDLTVVTQVAGATAFEGVVESVGTIRLSRR